MGKRYSDLWPQVTAWENLVLAWRKARKGKRGKPPAATFELNPGENLLRLQRELESKTYRPGAYDSFTIHEPKRRLISAAPFRDRVVHHALCNVIEPLFERRFIGDCYANRVGKGTHRALDRCQQFARRYRYVLQCDVEQFFPAIDHAILRDKLAWVIGDDDVLWLVDRILESGAGVLGSMYDMRWFAGDDPSTGSGQGLLAALRPRGLPVGNLTSQFWANVYLDSLDQFVKRELRCPAYLRFVDDFLLFSDHKHLLRRWRADVIEHLAGLRLTLHADQAHARPTTEGIPFLGFIVYPTPRRLKPRKGIQYRRRFEKLLHAYAAGAITFDELDVSVQGWINHVRYGDTWGLRRSLFATRPVPPQGHRKQSSRNQVFVKNPVSGLTGGAANAISKNRIPRGALLPSL